MTSGFNASDAERFHDPINDRESAHDPLRLKAEMPSHEDLDLVLDPLGRMLEALEASIEGSIAPPRFEPEPLVLDPPASGHIEQGALSPPPSLPLEPDQRPYTELRAEPAARPFFTDAGLSPPPEQSHGHAGAGIRSDSSLALTRWCAETNTFVDGCTCPECGLWDDDAFQCDHDSTDESDANVRDGDANEDRDE